MTTELSGNTTPSSSNFRGRAFQFTLNQIEKFDVLISELTRLKSCDYIIACKEIAPTTNHEHIHCYAHFESAYKLNKHIVEIGAHIEVCRGTPQENIAYIKKDGNIIFERGDEPHQGRPCTIRELKTLPKDEVPPMMFKTWQAVQSTKIKKSDWRKNVEVHYICGPSGIGKSNLAEELADDEFDEVKFVNGFWSPCSGDGCCIYDDFRSSHMPASEFINFIDYRTHNMNVKGGTVRNNYTKIIITSIQTIDELYSNMPSEAKEQWKRRMIIHDLTPTNNIDISVDN